MSDRNWAGYACEHYFQAHRGAFVGPDGQLIVFGNDGYAKDERVRRDISLIEEWLSANGFGINPMTLDPEDHYSWAFEVLPPQGLSAKDCVGAVDDAVWDCFARSRETSPPDPLLGAFIHCQRRQAEAVLPRS